MTRLLKRTDSAGVRRSNVFLIHLKSGALLKLYLYLGFYSCNQPLMKNINVIGLDSLPEMKLVKYLLEISREYSCVTKSEYVLYPPSIYFPVICMK